MIRENNVNSVIAKISGENTQKKQQMSFKDLMSKWSVLHVYNKILLNTETHNNLDGSQDVTLSEKSQSQNVAQLSFYLHNLLEMANF